MYSKAKYCSFQSLTYTIRQKRLLWSFYMPEYKKYLTKLWFEVMENDFGDEWALKRWPSAPHYASRPRFGPLSITSIKSHIPSWPLSITNSALDFIVKNKEKRRILYSDSQSVLQAIQSYHTGAINHPLIIKSKSMVL